MSATIPPWLTLLGVIPFVGGLIAIVGAVVDLAVDRPHERFGWRDLAFLIGCALGLVAYTVLWVYGGPELDCSVCLASSGTWS